MPLPLHQVQGPGTGDEGDKSYVMVVSIVVSLVIFLITVILIIAFVLCK